MTEAQSVGGEDLNCSLEGGKDGDEMHRESEVEVCGYLARRLG